eukprot:5016565-Lingulodinium_polyedra.AAC.1
MIAELTIVRRTKIAHPAARRQKPCATADRTRAARATLYIERDGAMSIGDRAVAVMAPRATLPVGLRTTGAR